MTFALDSSIYGALYGPAEGDLVRLGDTNLFARVERNLVPVGEEGLIGARFRSTRANRFVSPNRTRSPSAGPYSAP